MSRYIDAELTKKLLHEYCVDDDEEVESWYKLMGIDSCIDQTVPTADVSPVVHGEWIPEPFGYGECSVCHTKTGNRFAEKFCHNCGAKMDGGK